MALSHTYKMEKINVTKKDVVSSPKDTILEAVVIEANKTTWVEIIAPDKIKRFEEPDKEIIQIKYELNYEGRNIKGDDTFNYFEKPMDNSKMGMYLNKYESFEPGTRIKILYSVDGIPKIKVD